VFAHLLRTARQQAAIDVLPGHRVKHCLRTPIKRGTLAYDLYHSPANMRARLAGVQTCGRVWVCAVCAARITEVKRGEVEEAIIAHRLGGGVVLFVTLTARHSSSMALAPLLDRFLKGIERMAGNRPYRRLMAGLGSVGSIKALEVTWGAGDGFHPHAHLLLFLRPVGALDVSEVTRDLYDCWMPAARAMGLGMSRRRGVEVKDTWGGVADYFAKFGGPPKLKARAWGPEDELVKWTVKHARKGDGEVHYSPFALLDEWKIGGDPAFAARFVEYARAFKGRRQLVWTRGLRARLLASPDERTDEELAGLADDDEVLLGVVAAALYREVVTQRKVGRFFAIAGRGDMAAVDAFLADVRLEADELAREAAPLVDPVTNELAPFGIVDGGSW
jgi:hypothetical protein